MAPAIPAPATPAPAIPPPPRLSLAPLLLSLAFLGTASCKLCGQEPKAEQTAEAAFAKGKALAEQKEFAAALEPLTQAIDAECRLLEAHRWRGHCRTALGKYADALEDLDAAIALDQSHAWTFYARGMAKHHLQRPAQAIQDYSRALQLDPVHYKALHWRGFNRHLMKDFLGAHHDFSQALKLDKDLAWVRLSRGKAASALGALDAAAADFRASLAMGDQPDAHGQLGYLLAAQGKTKDALQHLAKSMAPEQSPLGHAHLWQWWLRHSMGKGALADEELLAAMEQSVTNQEPDPWPAALGSYLLGRSSQEDLGPFLHALGRVASAKANGRSCELWFFTACKQQLAGQKTEALQSLSHSLALGTAEKWEWLGSLHQIQAMGDHTLKK